MLERATKGGRDRAGSGPDFYCVAIGVVAHHHPARIARQALRRLRGNARPAVDDGLARRLSVGQHVGIDVDDNLIALGRSTGVDPMMECRLGR